MIRLMFPKLVEPIDVVLRKFALGLAFMAILAMMLRFSLRGARLTGEASGMVDAEMLGLLWQTAVGTALATRMLGIGLLIIGLVIPAGGRWIAVLGGGIALWSFARIGHVPDHGSLWLNLLLLLHLAGVAFWVGILSPLKWLARMDGHIDSAATLGHRFGQIATVVVPALIIAGGIMLWQLTGSFDVIFGTSYGRALVIKIVIVGGLLTLAAANKVRFIPAMQAGNADAAIHLSHAITLEWLVILTILLATAILTSVLTLPM